MTSPIQKLLLEVFATHLSLDYTDYKQVVQYLVQELLVQRQPERLSLFLTQACMSEKGAFCFSFNDKLDALVSGFSSVTCQDLQIKKDGIESLLKISWESVWPELRESNRLTHEEKREMLQSLNLSRISFLNIVNNLENNLDINQGDYISPCESTVMKHEETNAHETFKMSAYDKCSQSLTIRSSGVKTILPEKKFVSMVIPRVEVKESTRVNSVITVTLTKAFNLVIAYEDHQETSSLDENVLKALSVKYRIPLLIYREYRRQYSLS